MNAFMLWFDNDPKTKLAVKIARAVAYYQRKYGVAPDLCLVNPSNVEADIEAGITVRPYRPVLPGHLWIGVEQVAGALQEKSESLAATAEDIRRAIDKVEAL